MNVILKSIIKHTSIYSFGRLASKAVGFLLIPLYTNYLSPQDYGVQELLTILVLLTGIIIQGGISTAIFKFFNSYQDAKERNSVISTILIFLTIACLVFSGILWVAADRLSIIFLNSKEYGYYVRLMLVSFFFSTVANVPETFMMAKKESRLFTMISVGTLVVNLTLNIYMVAIAKLGILGILYASVIARFLNTCALLSITLPVIPLRFDVEVLLRVLKFSLPLIPAELGLFVFAFSDRLFLSHMSNLESVGLYSLGYKFAFMISLLLIQPFMQIWQQEMYDVKPDPDARRIFGNIYTYVMGMVMLAAAILSIFIKDVLCVIAAPDFFNAWRVVPIIAFAYVFRATHLYFQLGMLFENRTSYISYVTVVGAISALALNYILIPRFDELGAAFSCLGSYLILGIATLVLSQKLYKVTIETFNLLKLSIIIGGTTLLYTSVDIHSLPISLVFRSTSIPVMLLAMHVTGLIPKGTITKLRYSILAKTGSLS